MPPCHCIPPPLPCPLLAVLFTLTVSAVDLTTQKLFGKWSLTPTGYYLGVDHNSTVLTPKWIVLGSPGAQERTLPNEGGVQVFNAITGAFVRKLLPPGAPAANQLFGSGVAVSGDLAVIGAYGTNSTGRAYIYNPATGALLRTLNASDAAASDFFGRFVATNGIVAAVGAYGDDSFTGAVYLFDVATGLQLHKFVAFDGAVNSFFGHGLAMEGNILAVGAAGNDANRGAVYFFDLTARTLMKKHQPAASIAGDDVGEVLAMHEGRVVIGGRNAGKVFLYDLATSVDTNVTLGGTGVSFGQTVAIHGPLIAVGERLSGQGRVHLFKSSDGSFLQTILPPNGDTNDQRFGTCVALDGTSLLATAPEDSLHAPAAGAAHLIKPLTQPMAYAKVAGKGDFAPGALDISYGTFGEVCVNAGGATLFSTTLAGAGSNKGLDQGVFSNLGSLASLKLLFKTRQPHLGTAVYGLPSRLSMNDDNLAIGFSTLTGAGVNATNNLLLWFKTDAGSGTLLRTGTPVAAGALTGFIPVSISEAVTSNQAGMKGMAAICTLKLGTAGVTAATDSALYSNQMGTGDEALREGAFAVGPLPAGSKLGQFAPRIAQNYQMEVFSTALTDTGITATTNAALFYKGHGATEILVAQKGGTTVTDKNGNPLPGVVNYSAFLGESANGDAGAVYRATLTGTGVTAANNDGVWVMDSTPQRRLAFRKGQTLLPLPGLIIARIINFWSMGNSNLSENQVLALVQLAGTGVNAANDQALIVFHHDGLHNVLMREGDAAPGCLGARIGVISRIEADAWSSSYALIVTLTGATTTSDLALYTGNLLRGNSTTDSQFCRPFLRLRKGQLFDNQPGKVKSIFLTANSLTASGAAGTGRGRAISYIRDMAFTVEFENGIRQIMRGSAN